MDSPIFVWLDSKCLLTGKITGTLLFVCHMVIHTPVLQILSLYLITVAVYGVRGIHILQNCLLP